MTPRTSRIASTSTTGPVARAIIPLLGEWRTVRDLIKQTPFAYGSMRDVIRAMRKADMLDRRPDPSDPRRWQYRLAGGRAWA